MTDNLTPVRCGCGGEAVANDYIDRSENKTEYFVHCVKCGICSADYDSKDEAITAWNRAMGAKDINVPNKERTAKVEDLEKRSETSLSWEGICKNCGSYTMHEMNYCFGCGARLEWE